MKNTLPDITISVIPNSSVYVFTIQARNTEDAITPELTVGQVEAARNAAAATLETTGAIINSTASVVSIPASAGKSFLTLTPSIDSSEAGERSIAGEE